MKLEKRKYEEIIDVKPNIESDIDNDDDNNNDTNFLLENSIILMERPKLLEAQWSYFLPRLKQQCPAFVECLKQNRKGGKIDAQHLSNIIQLLINCCWPENIENDVSNEIIDKIRLSVHDGVFGLRKYVRNLFAKFPNLNINKHILEIFNHAPILTLEEELVFKKLQTFLVSKKLHYPEREVVLQNINALKKLVINALNIENISFFLNLNDAVEYCCNNVRGFESRLYLLIITGLQYNEAELRYAIKNSQDKEEYLNKLWLQTKSTSKYPIVLYREFIKTNGNIKEIFQTKTAEEIISLLKHIKRRKSHLIGLICKIAKDQGYSDLAKNLQLLNDVTYTGLDDQTKFSSLSLWHKELFNHVIFMESSKNNIAFLQRHLDVFKPKIAKMLLRLNNICIVEMKLSLEDFLKNSSFEILENLIVAEVSKCEARNDVIKSSHSSHHAKTAATLWTQLFRFHLVKFMNKIPNIDKLQASYIVKKIPNKRIAADASIRRTYTDEEILKMFQTIRDPADQVMLILLQEVALRNSAIGHLKYFHLLTSNHLPRTTCSVMEKGKKYRNFTTSIHLQKYIKLLSDHVRSQSTNYDLANIYILNLTNPLQPLSRSTIDTKLKKMAIDANIENVKVHCHAFRHTLVTKLCGLGNDLETVSKFMGHNNSQTTSYFYWLPSPEQLDATMINPFKSNYHEKMLQKEEANLIVEAANSKVRTCREIIDILLQNSNPNTIEQLNKIKPDWTEMLNVIDTPCELSQIVTHSIKKIENILPTDDDFV